MTTTTTPTARRKLNINNKNLSGPFNHLRQAGAPRTLLPRVVKERWVGVNLGKSRNETNIFFLQKGNEIQDHLRVGAFSQHIVWLRQICVKLSPW